MDRSIEMGSNLQAVTIRPGTTADAPRLRELRLKALSGHPQAYSSDYDTALNDPLATWVDRLERYARSVDETLQLAETATEADAVLVGMTGIYRDPRVKIRHMATIWGVYVDPAWRGQRIGERLVKACLDWAAAHEVVFVRLAVVSNNVSAIQCYLHCGFSVYGVEPKSLRWEGRYYDELLMGCDLEVKR
jgi:ribosomal protein S18 acetylase RimI-like enzyme